MPPRRRPTITALFCLCLYAILSQAGCQKQDEIRQYSVPKSDASNLSATGAQIPDDGSKDRLIGAIVPNDEKTWFFKMTGPDETVANQMQGFLALVRSIRFEKGEPRWTLPEGWQQLAASGMRFSTFLVRTDAAPLEVSVIPLPTGAGDAQEYALSNINRWRGQIGLGPMSQDELFAKDKRTEETIEIKLEETTAILVNMVGKLKTGGMGRGPFAGNTRVSPRPKPLGPVGPAGPPGPKNAPRKSAIGYKVPEGWNPGKAGSFRKAAFEVSDGNQSVEITVIDLAAAGGELLPNVNRWRQQIQLKPTTAKQLEQQVKKISIAGVTGKYVELVGSSDTKRPQTILGVIAIADGKSWFIKLKGDSQLAKREKERFEQFARSITFNGTQGAGNVE